MPDFALTAGHLWTSLCWLLTYSNASDPEQSVAGTRPTLDSGCRGTSSKLHFGLTFLTLFLQTLLPVLRVLAVPLKAIL